MDFVQNNQPLDEDYEDLGIYEDEMEKPKKKRRKTTGDEPASASKYHTQTITQIEKWSFTPEREEEGSICDIFSSSQRSKELRRKGASENAKPQKPAIQRPSRRKSAPGSMGPPQTPHRRLAPEIPSSESPATPPSRTSSFKGSALEERSINIPIPFNTDLKPQSSPSKLPKLRVEDTFESEDITQQTQIPTTPSKRSSPPKSVRWAEVDEIHEIDEVTPSTKEIGTQLLIVGTTKPSTLLRDEILDSEDDHEDCESSEDDLSEGDKEGFQSETCYGQIGLETQKLLETQKRLASPCIEESQILDREVSEELLEEKHHIVESQILGEGMSEDVVEEKTQYMESQRLATQYMHAMAPRTIDSDAFVSIRPDNVTKIVNRTMDHDFRHRQVIPDTVSRIWIYETAPTRILKYMAVITAAKRPGEILNEDGVGNAEFNAKAPGSGALAYEILELYELADPLPWATIVSNEWLTTQPMKPKLVKPAVRDQLMANLKPPLFCRDPPPSDFPTSSSVDTQEAEEQLLSTMLQYTQQPPFTNTSSQVIKQEDESDEEVSHTTPQDSLQGTLMPSHPSSSQITKQGSKQDNLNDKKNPSSIPQEASQGIMAPPKERETPFSLSELLRSSQAETVDLSPYQTPRRQSVAEIVFESPTRPIFSSTPINLPTPRERETFRPDSLVPYSMTSSQLLTKSQMLPESLLNDSLPGPPLFIQDSDEEDDL